MQRGRGRRPYALLCRPEAAAAGTHLVRGVYQAAVSSEVEREVHSACRSRWETLGAARSLGGRPGAASQRGRLVQREDAAARCHDAGRRLVRAVRRRISLAEAMRVLDQQLESMLVPAEAARELRKTMCYCSILSCVHR